MTGSVVILVMAALVLLLAWDRKRRLYLQPAIALALAGIVVVAWGSYSASYARFIVAEVKDSELRLGFAGPFARELPVSPASIETVLFGSPGKSNRQCYIKIVLKTGDSYRSSTLDEEPGACKKLRRELLEALAR